MNELKLKSLRILNGLTQAELAEKIGLSEWAYSRRESGDTPFKDGEIRKLKNALKLNNDEIVEIFFADDVATNARL